ncbi:hypothetical protein BpHYR1_049090 [Brachionus plicatilis]|uniref:Uncharacterized protein n=1 Tax=Brachionus plicatilis TaxID=10195 RepID=A0A3M7R6Y1_BRAPC|nr:hypothetical protein BpHYR1_049090 [Brachionus plicatilis]
MYDKLFKRENLAEKLSKCEQLIQNKKLNGIAEENKKLNVANEKMAKNFSSYDARKSDLEVELQGLKEKLGAFSEEKGNSIEARENLAEKLSKCEAVKAYLEAEVLELSRQDIAKIQLQDEIKMIEKKLVVLGIENSFFDKKLKELNGSKKQFIDPNFEGDSIIRFYGMKKTKCPFKFCGGKGHIDPKRRRHLRNESSMLR